MTLSIYKKANNRQYCLNTLLGVNELQKVNEEKEIGVVIDSSLIFEIHVAHCPENKKGKQNDKYW